MASKRIPMSRQWKDPLPDGLRHLFETGQLPADADLDLLAHRHALQGGHDSMDTYKLWRTHRAAIVADWGEQHPGTRPAAWWAWDRPEKLRRRLGGTGQCRVEVLPGMGASLDYGIDLGFWDRADQEFYDEFDPTVQGVVFDVNDPPVFESQATYLQRHALLTPAERDRLTPADYAHERIAPGVEDTR